MTCHSCIHIRYTPDGLKCVGEAIRGNKCPNVDSRMCERFVYFPGSDQKEDEQ